MTRLGLDVRGLTASRRRQPTGVGQYALGLASALSHECDELHLFGAPGGSLPGVEADSRATSRLAQIGAVWGAVGLSVAARGAPIDAMIIPEQYCPVALQVPALVVVHDVAFVSRPDAYEWRLRTQLLWSTRFAVRAAAHVIAVSEHTRRELLERLGVPAGRVTTVYPGIDHRVFRPRPRAESASTLDILGVRPPYILYIGALHRRKNLGLLLCALELMPDVRVVMAGPDYGARAALERIVAERNLGSQVTFLGYVCEEARPHLISQASAVVMPSPSEGFGLPAVEALASGVAPVIVPAGALPEVVGSYGYAAASLDRQGLKDAILAAIEDCAAAGLREERVRWAARFSWDTAAHRIAALAGEATQ